MPERISSRELLRRVGEFEDDSDGQRFIRDLKSGFRAVGGGFTAWSSGPGMFYWEPVEPEVTVEATPAVPPRHAGHQIYWGVEGARDWCLNCQQVVS